MIHRILFRFPIAVFNSIPLRDLFPLFYAFVWDVTALQSHSRIGTPDSVCLALLHVFGDSHQCDVQTGIVIFPPQRRASRSAFKADEVYLIDVLTHLYLWIGQDVDPDIIASFLPQEHFDALGQGSAHSFSCSFASFLCHADCMDRALVSLAMMESDLSQRLFALLSAPRLALRSSSPDIIVIKQVCSSLVLHIPPLLQ